MPSPSKWLVAALAAGALATAQADSEFSGQVRLRWDDRSAATHGPLARSAQLAPELIALPADAAAVETELRGRWQMLSAAVALRQERPEGATWRSDAAVNELYASSDALGWQFSAGRKIVAWDVGYAFRPNDVVQQETRRTLVSTTPQGRALVQAEHFDAQTAWSLVWVNPQRAADRDDAVRSLGADEQALALRVYRHVGEADWHGFARYGQHTRASLGAAVSWVASDSLEVHASGRVAERADVLSFDGPAQGLVGSSPYRMRTQGKTAQALIGSTWTAENKLSLMGEWWYDGAAASNAQWSAWNARNRQLVQTWVPGAPNALRRGVAGNMAWQAQAFGTPSLRRTNVYARIAWDHEGWQPALDVLYMPADRGRTVGATLGWQGNRVRLDAGMRVNGGPEDSVAAQLPVRRQVFTAATLAF